MNLFRKTIQPSLTTCTAVGLLDQPIRYYRNTQEFTITGYKKPSRHKGEQSFVIFNLDKYRRAIHTFHETGQISRTRSRKSTLSMGQVFRIILSSLGGSGNRNEALGRDSKASPGSRTGASPTPPPDFAVHLWLNRFHMGRRNQRGM